MYDNFYAEIAIGGKIKEDLIPGLLARLSVKSIDYLKSESPYLLYDNCEARYGQFEEAEEFLRRHKIPYNRESAGYAEFTPEISRYRPETGLHIYEVLHDGTMVVDMQQIRKYTKELKDLVSGGVFDTMRLQKIINKLEELTWVPPSMPGAEII
jgi:hypothetical protein